MELCFIELLSQLNPVLEGLRFLFWMFPEPRGKMSRRGHSKCIHHPWLVASGASLL